MTSSLLPLLFRFNPVTVANEAAMLAIVGASEGTIAFRTDLGVSFICGTGDPTHLASWTEMSFPDIPIPTLDAIPAAVADVDLHSHKLKNVADAGAATDALNRETGDGRYDAIGAGAAAQAASAQGLAPTAVKTGAYTAAAGDLVPVDVSGGSVPITLPTAPADKTRIGVKVVKVDGSHANSCSIARGGTDVFNIAAGATSLTLSALFQGVLLQYKTSSGIWYVSTADTPLATPLGAAKLGADGTLTGTGGSGLPASVVTDNSTTPKSVDSTGVTNGQGLLYDSASGKWKPGAVPPSASTVQMDSGSAPTVDHSTALTDGAGWYYDQASGKVKGAALLQTPSGASDGDLFRFDGTALKRVPIGAAGKILTVVGGEPAWATNNAPAAGSWSDPAYFGVLAHSYPSALSVINGQNLRPTKGQLIGVKVSVPTTLPTVTNIVVDQNQAGSATLANNYLAIVSSSGTVLGVTADLSTTWASTAGPLIVPISGGPIAVPGGSGAFVWVVCLTNSSGTNGVGLRGAVLSTVVNYCQTAATYECAQIGGLTAQTSIAGPYTVSSNASNNAWFWCALT